MSIPTPEPAPDTVGALAGLRVLELATLHAGPSLAAILADLGADVVKVEPPTGDDLRVLGQGAGGSARPGLFTLVNRNKAMISLDYKADAGREILGRLTAVADVVVLNQPIALLERLDCTYEAIAARNPRAIVVYVSGWGATGPYRDRTGNGTLGEAFAGLTDLGRHQDGVPRLSGALFGDHLTALAGVIGTLAACYWRDAHGGRGQLVDVALYEAVAALLGPQIVAFDPAAGRPTSEGPPRRVGPGIRDSFETADGRWVVVTSYSTAQITRLLDAVGVDVSGPGGEAPTPDLASLVSAWIADNDLATVLAAFETARIGIAPVNDIGALLADAHAQSRRAVLEVDDPAWGTVRVPNPSPRLSATPGTVHWVARALGADNDRVYADWLGLGPDERARLATDGVP